MTIRGHIFHEKNNTWKPATFRPGDIWNKIIKRLATSRILSPSLSLSLFVRFDLVNLLTLIVGIRRPEGKVTINHISLIF